MSCSRPGGARSALASNRGPNRWLSPEGRGTQTSMKGHRPGHAPVHREPYPSRGTDQVSQRERGPQEPTETEHPTLEWHWVNVELVGAEEHVPVLREDPLRRGRPDARSTDTGCRALLSGATGIEKDIPLSARRANVLRGGYLTPCRAPAESRGGVPPHTAGKRRSGIHHPTVRPAASPRGGAAP